MVCQLCEYGDGHLGRKRTHEDQENDADKEENTSNKDGCSSCFGCCLEINGQRGHGIPLRRKLIVPCFIACLRAARNLTFRRVMTTSGRSAKPALEMVGVVGQKLSRRIWHALETLTLSHYAGSSFRQSETENPMALSPLTLVSNP
jgi:hypothetical protein